jgi:hypothetical protein
MAGPNLIMRPYSQDLLPQVAELMRHLWSADAENNQRYFSWKYESNPHQASSAGIVALTDGKVVGFRGYFVTPWKIPGQAEIVRILSPCDTCVAAEYRKWGVSVAMGKMAADLFSPAFPLFLNTTTTNQSLPGYRKLGFVPLATKAYFSAYGIVSLLRYLAAYFLHPSSASSRIRFREHPNFSVSGEARPEEMAALALRQPLSQGGLQPARDAKYLQWRFKNPRQAYVFYYAYKASRLTGYVIVGLSPNRRRGYILDFAEDDGSSASVLLQRIIASHDVDILSVASSSLGSSGLHWKALGFRENGIFRRLERYRCGELPLLIRPVSADYQESDWFIVGLDTRDIRSWQFREMVSDAF